MKQRLISIALGTIISCVLPLQAQTPFFNIYGSPRGDDGKKVVEVPGAGTLVGGRTDDASGWSDIVLTRIDANGNILWCTSTGTPDDDELTDIAVNPAGGFYALFTTHDPLAPSSYVSTIVAKLDTNGSLLWSKKFYETGHLTGTAIVATATGGFTFAGSFDSVNVNNTSHLQVTSCSGAGTILWSNLYATNVYAMPVNNEALHMTTTANGDYMIAQTYGTTSALQQVIRISATGAWMFGQHFYLAGRAVDVAYSGTRIVMLAYDESTHQATVYYCEDSFGFPLWTRVVQLDSTGYARMVAADFMPGKILLNGHYEDSGFVRHNFLMQLDTLGNLISSGEVQYPVNDARYLANGDVVFTGTLQGAHFGPSDTASMYLSCGNLTLETVCNYSPSIMAVDTALYVPNAFSCSSYSWGSITNVSLTVSTGTQILPGCVTGVDEQERPVVAIFPNPADEVINFVFTRNEARTITVFNALGEEIVSFASSELQVTINMASWTAGVYIVHVTGASGNSMQTISVMH